MTDITREREERKNRLNKGKNGILDDDMKSEERKLFDFIPVVSRVQISLPLLKKTLKTSRFQGFCFSTETSGKIIYAGTVTAIHGEHGAFNPDMKIVQQLIDGCNKIISDDLTEKKEKVAAFTMKEWKSGLI